MALHGLAHTTIAVPNVDATRAFYRDFGLAEDDPGSFSTSDGGIQLSIVEAPARRLIEVTIAATDLDDLHRVRHAADAAGSTYRDVGNDVVVDEPVVGVALRVGVRPTVAPALLPDVSTARGTVSRGSQRSPAITIAEPVRPRRLGHVLYATPDLAASSR